MCRAPYVLCLAAVTQPHRLLVINQHLFFRSDPEPVLSSAKGLLQHVNMLLEDVFTHVFKNLIESPQSNSNYRGRASGFVLYPFAVSFIPWCQFFSWFSRQPGKTPTEFSDPTELAANPKGSSSPCRRPHSSFRKTGFNTKSSGPMTAETGYFGFVAPC